MDRRDSLMGARSDNFWFVGKRGLIDILLSGLRLSQHAKILNIGVGAGEDLSVIKKYGIVYGLDIDQQALDAIPNELLKHKVLGDACSIPFAANAFDCVVAFDVLEHIHDDTCAVNEIVRVLKPGGILVVTVPAFSFLYSKHDVLLHHFRRYSSKQLRVLLSKQFDMINLI